MPRPATYMPKPGIVKDETESTALWPSLKHLEEGATVIMKKKQS